MKKKSNLRWLCSKIKKRIPALIIMTAASIGKAFMGVIFALGTKNVINSAVAGDRQMFLSACFEQLMIIMALLLFAFIDRIIHAKQNAVLDWDWKRQLGDKILHADYSKISGYHSGELLNFLNHDVKIINDGLLSVLPGFAGMFTKLISAVIVLLSLEPRFTMIFLGAGVLLLAMTGLARHLLKSLNKAVSESQGKVSAFFQEAFEKLMIVQAMNVEAETSARSEKVMAERYGFQKKRMAVTVTANTCIDILYYISGFAALCWCAYSLLKGEMSFGELTAVTQLVSQLQSPFVNLSGVLPQYIAMDAACDRLRELEENCFRFESEARGELPDFKAVKSICAENVSFSYSEEPVLSNCSFNIPVGSFAAVTGPSGIGKSTILKLMLGLFRPHEGEFYLDTGEGKLPLSLDSRSFFAYVPQGNLLFSGSIRENLLLTKPSASEEEINEAVSLSCMDEFISQLPEGLNTHLGENALGLSEGQAQRLSIARAVLSGAPVILLDEATSALDAETEKRVLENLRQMPGKTCIAVTHRAAASDMADIKLCFSEDGSFSCCEK